MSASISMAEVKAAFLRKRSANWNNAETMELLLGYAELKSGKKRRGRSTLFRLYEHLYSQKSPFKAGPNRSVTQIRVKLDNLKAIYRDKLAKEQTDWPFYQICDSIWSSNPVKREVLSDTDRVQLISVNSGGGAMSSSSQYPPRSQPISVSARSSTVLSDPQASSQAGTSSIQISSNASKQLLSERPIHSAKASSSNVSVSRVPSTLVRQPTPSRPQGVSLSRNGVRSKSSTHRFQTSVSPQPASSVSSVRHQTTHVNPEAGGSVTGGETAPFSLDEPMTERISAAARLSERPDELGLYTYSPTEAEQIEQRVSSMLEGSDTPTGPEDLTIHKDNQTVAGYRMPFRQLVVAARVSKPPPEYRSKHITRTGNVATVEHEQELSPLATGSAAPRRTSLRNSRLNDKARLPVGGTGSNSASLYASLVKQSNSLLQRLIQLEELRERQRVTENRLQREHELKMVETMGQYVCRAVGMLKDSTQHEPTSQPSFPVPSVVDNAFIDEPITKSAASSVASTSEASQSDLHCMSFSRAPSP